MDYNGLYWKSQQNTGPLVHVFSFQTILASNHLPELHKRCHRPLDPLALALSTCRVMEISLQNGLKWRNMEFRNFPEIFQKLQIPQFFNMSPESQKITKNHLQVQRPQAAGLFDTTKLVPWTK